MRLSILNLAKLDDDTRRHYILWVARLFESEWNQFDPHSFSEWENKVKTSCQPKDNGLPFRLIMIDEDKHEAGRPKLIGTVGADIRSSITEQQIDPRPDLSAGSDFGPWLRGLVIVPEYRGQHCSLQLIYAMLIFLKELGFSQDLYVWHFDPIVAEFYQKLGFNQIGIIPSIIPLDRSELIPQARSGKVDSILNRVKDKLAEKVSAPILMQSAWINAHQTHLEHSGQAYDI
ncbi:MAG: acetyltransferase [Gammaproteobacteria bacterium]|nr:acetyltransferase [Gammaproteobacteria bacterium]